MLFSRKAFLSGYEGHPVIGDHCEEMMNSEYVFSNVLENSICSRTFYFMYREIVKMLVEEYQAAESPDYLKWGTQYEEQVNKYVMF